MKGGREEYRKLRGANPTSFALVTEEEEGEKRAGGDLKTDTGKERGKTGKKKKRREKVIQKATLLIP